MEVNNGTLDIKMFDPNEEALRELAAIPVDITDPRDAGQVKAAHEKRMKLRTARVAIEKIGKKMREGALAFQKQVIAREKELVSIVEPEEDRLKTFEEEAEAIKEREARAALLPRRKEQLAEVGGDPLTDEAILDMDAVAFDALLNARQAAKNEAERLEIERKAEELKKREEEAIRAEQEAKERRERSRRDALFNIGLKWDGAAFSYGDIVILWADVLNLDDAAFDTMVANTRTKVDEARDAEKKAAEERARQEERERAEAEAARKEQERIEREAREKEEVERAKAEAEKRAQEERDHLERQEKYRAFRAEHGWTEEKKDDFREENTGTEIVLWQRVGTFKLSA